MGTRIKAVFFDFMGTCLDWHSPVTTAFPATIPKETASKLALEWRQRYFDYSHGLNEKGLPVEDFNIMLSRVLHLLLTVDDLQAHFDQESKNALIRAWYTQYAWPEVSEAIRCIREELGLEVFVQANGTTRLQLDLVRSSGLRFDMLLSSELLGVYKPNPEAYKKALGLVRLQPSEVVLVAAHAYDLRGAAACGLRTIYIHRWTDDIDEDQEKLKNEFHCYLEDMEGLPEAILHLSEEQ